MATAAASTPARHGQGGVEDGGPGEQAHGSRLHAKGGQSESARRPRRGRVRRDSRVATRRFVDACKERVSVMAFLLFFGDLHAGEAFELLAVEDGVVDHAEDELLRRSLRRSGR